MLLLQGTGWPRHCEAIQPECNAIALSLGQGQCGECYKLCCAVAPMMSCMQVHKKLRLLHMGLKPLHTKQQAAISHLPGSTHPLYTLAATAW